MPERAVLFIDGNNWYHGLREISLMLPTFFPPTVNSRRRLK